MTAMEAAAGFQPVEVHDLGRIGRVGLWTVDHRKAVAVTWGVIAVGLGSLAPFAEKALSGAGWEAAGSESVETRALVEKHFPGKGAYALSVVVTSDRASVNDAAFRATLARVRAVLEQDPAVARVLLPRQRESVSADGHTALVQGDAARAPDGMVRAAERLEGPLAAAAAPGVDVHVAGPAGMWSDFNAQNKAAMLKSELLSWPLTLTLLVVAFGSLVAAGLPLLLTILGLMSAAGVLFVAGSFADVSIWAMNFALMFALALGIDYALFVVVRFRGALARGRGAREAVGVAMDTAGKAVLASGLVVVLALLAVTLVPSPTFRSVPLGIVLSVVFVLAAALTLLPAVLSRLGSSIDRGALPAIGSVEYRSPRFARWGELLWRRPLPLGLAALAVLIALALPALDLRTGMPSILVVPEDASSRVGYDAVTRAFGPGAAAPLQIVVPESELDPTRASLAASPAVAAVGRPLAADGLALVSATPKAQPASVEFGHALDEIREALPPSALVGGAAAENEDLRDALISRTPLVIAVVLAIGFALLLVLLRAPIVSAVAVLLNVFAVGAAFGVAKLIFQDGNLEGLLRFESQGFVDAWAPVFFFAMTFALAMDYTVFLLASVKERFEETRDPRRATVAGLADSGRVINAAGGVMVVVFLTFALSGPIPPKEMGVVLAVAVLLDATLIRLLLLPVVLRLLGARAWWVPAWLDRLLPDVQVGHGAPAG